MLEEKEQELQQLRWSLREREHDLEGLRRILSNNETTIQVGCGSQDLLRFSILSVCCDFSLSNILTGTLNIFLTRSLIASLLPVAVGLGKIRVLCIGFPSVSVALLLRPYTARGQGE